MIGYWYLNRPLIWNTNLECGQLAHSHWAWLQKLAWVAQSMHNNGTARVLWSFRLVHEAVAGIWTTLPNGVYSLSPQICSAATLQDFFRCSSSSCIGGEQYAAGRLVNKQLWQWLYHVVSDCGLSCKSIWSACVETTVPTVQSKQAPSFFWYQDSNASMHAIYIYGQT